MNYDTSIILIGNKSGQGENKERRICASLRGERENKSCRQSFRFANWPTLKQTRQSCKRIGASSSLCCPLPLLFSSQLLWSDRSSIKRALTSNVKSASWPRTDGRTDGRLGSVVSYDEDVRKLIHQTVQIRCSVHLSQARGRGAYSLGPWPCLQCQPT